MRAISFKLSCKSCSWSSSSAIYRYQQIAEFTNGIDFTTCDIAKHIMAEEEDHEQDLLEGLLTKLVRIRQVL